MKYGQCSACGFGVTPVTKKPGAVTAVTEDDDYEYHVLPPSEGVRTVPPAEPGQVCPLCGEKKPSEAALKQRAWRSKTRAAERKKDE